MLILFLFYLCKNAPGVRHVLVMTAPAQMGQLVIK